MLSNARLSWAEAVNKASNMINKAPSKTMDCKTWEEVWSDNLDDY